MIPIYRAKEAGEALQQRLLSRSQTENDDVRRMVQGVIAAVRQEGNEALLRYTERFDGVRLTPESLRVSEEEIQAAYQRVDPEWLAALSRAADNIRSFHEKQVRESWMEACDGKKLGQIIRPLDRVGVYAPGGTAAYPSSVLMNLIPASVAGVQEVVLATPPGKDGHAYYLTVVAAREAGATEILKMGGAQAIAALAYGTETIRRVDKITGPGNVYVANAKREVFGHVGIDMIAGPSEVLIIADETANPRFVAADLLSQAEHDPLSAVILITDSGRTAVAVQREAEKQANLLERHKIVCASLENYGTIIVVDDLAAAVELANTIAPEHLEIVTRDPEALLPTIRHAGSIFLGAYAPEPLGDYYAGPNHVLPTSGTARFFSPLGVDDFIHKSSVIAYSRDALHGAWRDISRLAREEGLTAHARAVEIRFESEA